MNGEIFSQFDAGACRELLIMWNRESSSYNILYHDLHANSSHVVCSTTNYQDAIDMTKSEVERLRGSNMCLKKGCSLHLRLGKYYLSLPGNANFFSRFKRLYMSPTAAWLYMQVCGRYFTMDELSDLIQDKYNWTHVFSFVRAQQILNNWVLADIVIR